MTLENEKRISEVSETVSKLFLKLDKNGRERLLLMIESYAAGVEAGRSCSASVRIGGASGNETAPQEVSA